MIERPRGADERPDDVPEGTRRVSGTEIDLRGMAHVEYGTWVPVLLCQAVLGPEHSKAAGRGSTRLLVLGSVPARAGGCPRPTYFVTCTSARIGVTK